MHEGATEEADLVTGLIPSPAMVLGGDSKFFGKFSSTTVRNESKSKFSNTSSGPGLVTFRLAFVSELTTSLASASI